MNIEQLTEAGFVESYDVDGQTGIRATQKGINECAVGGPLMNAIVEALTDAGEI